MLAARRVLRCRRSVATAAAAAASDGAQVTAAAAATAAGALVVEEVILDPPAVGYEPWRPGAVRRHAWPLFGLRQCPPLPPAAAVLAGRLFGAGARYLGDDSDLCTPAAAAKVRWREVVVVGRSNVGKSSLLNAVLAGRGVGGAAAATTFVPVSRHPGSTTHIDFYGVGDGVAVVPDAVAEGDGSVDHEAAANRSITAASPGDGRRQAGSEIAPSAAASGISLAAAAGSTSSLATTHRPAGAAAASWPQLVVVDTPGYGYSRRGKATAAAWLETLQRYLATRSPAILARIFVLVDGRHGVTPTDRAVLDALDAALCPYTLVLTKIDEAGDAELEARAWALATAVARRPMLQPVLHAVSAHTGEGLPALLASMVHAARLHARALDRSSSSSVASEGATPWLGLAAGDVGDDDDGGRAAATTVAQERRQRGGSSGMRATAGDERRRPRSGAGSTRAGSPNAARAGAGSGTSTIYRSGGSLHHHRDNSRGAGAEDGRTWRNGSNVRQRPPAAGATASRSGAAASPQPPPSNATAPSPRIQRRSDGVRTKRGAP